MKPPPFRYERPESLEEALALLARYGDEALPLAGGQSLVPMLNLRVSRPSVLVDLNRVAGLGEMRVEGDRLHLGAMVRYVDLERSPLVATTAPLLGLALPHVAHVAVRNRGTVGGSLALADPAAELPACAVALDAVIHLASRSGERAMPAGAFIVGAMETARRPDELLVAVRLRVPRTGERFFFHELARRHGDYALAGVAGAVRVESGRVAEAVVVVFGCGDGPVFATHAAAALAGARWDETTRRAVRAAVRRDVAPLDAPQASGAYRVRLAQVALVRALDAVLGRASGTR